MQSILRNYIRRHATAATRQNSSVNASEISFFSKLSSQWWDEHGEFAFLHRMNPIRMQFIHDKVREMGWEDGAASQETLSSRSALDGLKVLDIGCGGGLLSEVISLYSQSRPSVTHECNPESGASRGAHPRYRCISS